MELPKDTLGVELNEPLRLNEGPMGRKELFSGINERTFEVK